VSHSRFALGFTRNRKVFRLSDAAFRLWISSVDFSRDQKTDGRLLRADLELIPRAPTGKKLEGLIAELVAIGLWEVTDFGWAIHDYHDWQDSADEAERKLERARERMRGVRQYVRANDQRTFADSSPDSSPEGSSSVQIRVNPPPDSDPLPSSPDPDPTRARASGRKRKPVTALPADFDEKIRPVALAEATAKGSPAWWVSDRLDAFRDLALAKSWVYADWLAAIRNFLRGERNYGRGPEQLKHLAGAATADLERRRAEKAAAEAELQRSIRAELGTGERPVAESQQVLASVLGGVPGRRGGAA